MIGNTGCAKISGHFWQSCLRLSPHTTSRDLATPLPWIHTCEIHTVEEEHRPFLKNVVVFAIDDQERMINIWRKEHHHLFCQSQLARLVLIYAPGLYVGVFSALRSPLSAPTTLTTQLPIGGSRDVVDSAARPEDHRAATCQASEISNRTGLLMKARRMIQSDSR